MGWGGGTRQLVREWVVLEGESTQAGLAGITHSVSRKKDERRKTSEVEEVKPRRAEVDALLCSRRDQRARVSRGKTALPLTSRRRKGRATTISMKDCFTASIRL